MLCGIFYVQTKRGINLNIDYYENLDENFTQAMKMYESTYSHEELISFLKSGNIVQRQIAALMLDTINSKDDANVLLSNLTGIDGKIREAVSLRLNEFVSAPEILPYFADLKNCRIFLESVIDINGNICRNVISALINLKVDDKFCEKFSSGLVEMTKSLLDVVENFNFQDGKYMVNKEIFKLYWCLETIYEFYDKINFSDLKEIIMRSKNIREYTIREKAAKILSYDFADRELSAAKDELRNDENYYVRRF